MAFSFLTPADYALSAPLILVVGVTLALAVGEVFGRVLHLPRITGYTIGGAVAGAMSDTWVSSSQLPVIQGIINLALMVLLFELGSRVNLQWFRHNRPLLVSCIAECALSFLACAVLAGFLGFQLAQALMIGALAVGTSPAVVMRMLGETAARGQVTQRLLAHTAFNSVVCFVLVKLFASFSPGADSWFSALGNTLILLVGALFSGAILALCFIYLRRFINLADEHGTALLFAILMLAFFALEFFHIPPLLPPLLAGIAVRNLDPRPLVLPRHLGSLGGTLVILLFCLQGLTIEWQHIYAGGLAALALVLVRAAAKGAVIWVFAPRSGLSRRQALAIGGCLTPFATSSLVLTGVLHQAGSEVVAVVFPIVLSAVLICELICPLAMQWSLRFCSETNE